MSRNLSIKRIVFSMLLLATAVVAAPIMNYDQDNNKESSVEVFERQYGATPMGYGAQVPMAGNNVGMTPSRPIGLQVVPLNSEPAKPRPSPFVSPLPIDGPTSIAQPALGGTLSPEEQEAYNNGVRKAQVSTDLSLPTLRIGGADVITETVTMHKSSTEPTETSTDSSSSSSSTDSSSTSGSSSSTSSSSGSSGSQTTTETSTGTTSVRKSTFSVHPPVEGNVLPGKVGAPVLR